MKAIFRFRRQHGSEDVEYEIGAIPNVGTEITGNNSVIYCLDRVEWQMDLDKRQCEPILFLKTVRDAA